MAGCTTATGLAIAGLAVGAVGTGYGIYSGQQQEAAQQQALKRQNTAQQQATAAALSTQRKSEIAQGAANQQTPDISNILYRAANGGKGLSSTMLTGPGGVDTSGLNLGKSTLLGS
jgi:hypothetical protein